MLKFTFSRFIWIILIAFIAYQITFTWIPLWQKSTLLHGTNVSDIQIENENGQSIYLSKFKGKSLIINFWASWCIPCQLEIPLLNAIYPNLLGKNKQLIGVNQNESQETINKFRSNSSITFPVYKDNGALSRKLNIQIIPAIAVIDKNGRVQSITYGFRPWIQAYLLWWV